MFFIFLSSLKCSSDIPWSIKAAGGVPKAILIKAMRGLLPDDIF
jgi:hypothetical protein